MQRTAGDELKPWRMPESFLGDLVDADGLSSASLSCLSHCLRDTLRGHGVSSSLGYLVRPLGLVFSVDRTFRPWLLGQAEEEFDEPSFENGLATSWCWVTAARAFAELVDGLLGSGRVAIVRANRWQVPWWQLSDLTPPDWHTSVIVERRGETVRLLDRQPAGGRIETRDLTVPLAQLDATVEFGAAVLEYSLRPVARDPREEGAALLLRSAANLAPRCLRSSGKEYGLRALDLLRTLFQQGNFGSLDSRHWRLMLRWQLPSCIRKYIVGNHQVLSLYLSKAKFAPLIEPPLLDAFAASVAAWETFARDLALAARASGASPAQRLIESLDRVRQAESALVGTISLGASRRRLDGPSVTDA